MSLVDWSKPAPMDGRTRYDYAAIVAELQERPGVWGLIVPNAGGSTQTNLRRRLMYRGCEVRTHRRSKDEKRRDIWARWVD